LIPFAKKTKGYDKGSRGWGKSNPIVKFTHREKALSKRIAEKNLGWTAGMNNPEWTTGKSSHNQMIGERNPTMNVEKKFLVGKSGMRHHVLTTTHVGIFLLLTKYWQPSCLPTRTNLHWTSMTAQQIRTNTLIRMSLS